MTSTSTRPMTSPNTTIPARFNTHNRDAKSSESIFSTNRLSTLSRTSDKRKTPSQPQPLADRTGGADTDSVKTTRTMAASSFTAYDRVRSSSTDKVNTGFFNSRKNRGSLLGAASDALGFKFGRKRPIIRQPPLPLILPDVIEISAPPPDHEVEERNRLREMAAQAIGISPYLAQPDAHSQEDSTEDDDDDDALRTPADNFDLRRFGDVRNSDTTPDFTNKNLFDMNLPSLVHSSASTAVRHRSGSMIHTRTNSTTFSTIPQFPTNVLSLNPFLACNSYLPKFSQPSSIRIFALSSRGWKNRYIVFSSPALMVSKSHTPTSSYLHVFKSSGPDEKEIERLEINEDSVIFVAEEEVGGRRSVIKVGGVEVGLGSQDANGKVQQTMWHLQILDMSESQKWISTIKNAILGQRTIRAGLGLPSTPTGFEPRGDLDVMLSIRAQGFSTTLQATSIASNSQYREPISPTGRSLEPQYASSISSQSIHSQATVPKPVQPSAVSTLKGLFTSRPRSSSRATSVDTSERQHTEREQDGSFSGMGNNLLRLRNNTVSITQSSFSSSSMHQRLPFAPSPLPPDQRSDRKVLGERQAIQWVNQVEDHSLHRAKETRSNRAMSLGALSLQPPPRKRWGSMRPTNPTDDRDFSSPPTPTSFATLPSSFNRAETEPPTSPVDFTSFSIPPRPRAPSLQSVSTRGSENTPSIDRSSVGTNSVGTKRSSSTNRRWSRPLPQRLTPPAGPPPAIPANVSVTKLNIHPHGLDDRQSSTASTHSSAKSSISTLPSFSKRTSSSSSNHSEIFTTPPARPARHSMPPPPKPAPTAALPPAPEPQTTPTPPPLPAPAPIKASFRNSVAQRAMRLSMIAPKPPPSTTLPPRPDEVNAQTHKRRSSSSGKTQILDTIPEPIQDGQTPAASPYPPPMGPLPPTPIATGPTSSTTSTPSVSRHSSLQHRLRILSAPSPISSTTPLPPTPRPMATSMTTSMYATHSTPSTPNSERITFFSNNDQPLSFLQMSTPVLSTVQPAHLFEDGAVDTRTDSMELLEHVTSLSPPPRRHSRPFLESAWVQQNAQPTAAAAAEPESSNTSPTMDTQSDDDDDDTNERFVSGRPSRIFSLSPPGSVVSLGPVSM